MIDIHTHLQRATSEQLATILSEAQLQGIDVFVLAGQDLESSWAGQKLALKEDSIWACVGLHPWMITPENMANQETILDGLRELARQPKVIGFGEIGLDHVRCPQETWRDQAHMLEEQLKLAAETELPAVLHNRGAHQEMLSIVRSLPKGKRPHGMVLHGFSGSEAEALGYLENGFYISIDKSLLSEEGKILGDAVLKIPLERLLLDSDASGKPGRPVPADLRAVAEEISRLKGISLEEVTSASERNARVFFPKMKRRN